MVRIDAIYRNGAFQPLGTVELRENQRVRLEVQAIDGRAAREWLQAAQLLRQDIARLRGQLPDSSADIAADRNR